MNAATTMSALELRQHLQIGLAIVIRQAPVYPVPVEPTGQKRLRLKMILRYFGLLEVWIRQWACSSLVIGEYLDSDE